MVNVIINNNITSNTIFSNKNTYFINNEVHVLANITLTIENKTNIFIVNGLIKSPRLNFNALIFDTGSKLIANQFTVKACNKNFVEEKKADNGGLWFCGSSAKADKDNIYVTYSTNTSSFTANKIYVWYLGHFDKDDKKVDDVDAISVLGVGSNEWNIKAVYSYYSGDDGFDVEESSITLETLVVIYPTEDALNITSSRVNITKCFEAKTYLYNDRHLFDLEVDKGPSYVRLAKGCKVCVNGIFGTEVTLVTADMPPVKGNVRYVYSGILTNGQSYIYSTKFDAPKLPQIADIYNFFQDKFALKFF